MLTPRHPTKQEDIHLNWFNDNSMKADSAKYCFILSNNNSSKITIGKKSQFPVVNAKNFYELKQTIT